MTETPYHLQLIRERLSKKQRSNSAYSLRAFGRDIGMNSSTLSQVINGKRPFPLKNCDALADALRLSPLERMRLLESVTAKKRLLLDSIRIPAKDDRYLIEESHYRVIAEWEHYAVLTLFDLDGFDLNPDSISTRLDLTKTRTATVLQNLLNAELIRRNEDGRFMKAQASVRTTEDVSSRALRDSHFENLELGRKKLESAPVGRRDFSSVTFAFDPSQMTEIKVAIREFRKKILALARMGKKKTEVYQLALQLYPLTIPLNPEK